MSDLATLTEFFGWATVLNFAVLALWSLALMVGRKALMGTHARMFGLDEAELPGIYMNFLANFKIVAVAFSFVPYLALKIMA
jgi:hypothetical protein